MRIRLHTAARILNALALLLSAHVMTSRTLPAQEAAKPVAADPLPPSAAGYALVRAFPNVPTDRPVAVVIPPDGTKRLFLVLQGGKIVILPSDESASAVSTFLDISNRELVPPKGALEMGLLGLAFHPQFAQNGKFYLNYTRMDMMRSVVSEMQVSKSDPSKADPATERILLEEPQPFANHNSGNLISGRMDFSTSPSATAASATTPCAPRRTCRSCSAGCLRIDVNRTHGSRAWTNPGTHAI